METIYLNSQEIHTSGSLPQVGSIAPSFELVVTDLSTLSLSDMKGKRIVLNIFPSLDTDVCARSVRRFNQEAARLQNTVVLCVSKDLPFASDRFCVANGIDHVIAASAFRSSFGEDYGVELVDSPLRALLARALVVIDADGEIIATSLSKDMADEPDYQLPLRLLGS